MFAINTIDIYIISDINADADSSQKEAPNGNVYLLNESL